MSEFGSALNAFFNDLGDRMADTVVITMSEFGRTAKENGNRGTDHGHANLMFAMGGGVKGGKVYGRWPGLAPEQLYEGRDLAVTTDFRCRAERGDGSRPVWAPGISRGVFPGFRTIHRTGRFCSPVRDTEPRAVLTSSGSPASF